MRNEETGGAKKLTTDGAGEREVVFRAMLDRFAPLFWDTRVDALDVDAQRGYIMARLLNMGGMPGFICVEKLYSREEIVDCAIRRRDLAPRVRNFLFGWYGIPRERMQPPAGRWR